jgi:hypothetical protein
LIDTRFSKMIAKEADTSISAIIIGDVEVAAKDCNRAAGAPGRRPHLVHYLALARGTLRSYSERIRIVPVDRAYGRARDAAATDGSIRIAPDEVGIAVPAAPSARTSTACQTRHVLWPSSK